MSQPLPFREHVKALARECGMTFDGLLRQLPGSRGHLYTLLPENAPAGWRLRDEILHGLHDIAILHGPSLKTWTAVVQASGFNPADFPLGPDGDRRTATHCNIYSYEPSPKFPSAWSSLRIDETLKAASKNTVIRGMYNHLPAILRPRSHYERADTYYAGKVERRLLREYMIRKESEVSALRTGLGGDLVVQHIYSEASLRADLVRGGRGDSPLTSTPEQIEQACRLAKRFPRKFEIRVHPDALPFDVTIVGWDLVLLEIPEVSEVQRDRRAINGIELRGREPSAEFIEQFEAIWNHSPPLSRDESLHTLQRILEDVRTAGQGRRGLRAGSSSRSQHARRP